MSPSEKNMKECPWCGEEIRVAAVICRFCKNDVTERGEEAARRFASGEVPLSAPLPGPPAETPGAFPSAAERKAALASTSMPPTLLDQILAVGETIDEGERRPITVLFSDLCDFTALTGQLGAERMNDLLDRVYIKTQDVISFYGGIVEKFMGDAVMAVFGAPRAHGDDPERAIRAALDIRDAVRGLGSSEGLALDTHSGIAFGEVVFTARGEAGNIDYRSIGDAVNLASRLQHIAGDGETLVDHRTYQQTRTVFDWEEIAPFFVKGKNAPVVGRRVAGVRKKFSKVNLGERIALVPLVGRQTELGLLESMAAEARQGRRARVVWIEGESGVGKSRLVYEFYHRLPQEEWHWFTGRCLSYGEHMPFLPFIELFRSLMRPWGEEGEQIGPETLARLVERVYESASRGRKAAPREDVAERKRLAAAALALLLSIDAGPNPLLRLTPGERRERLFAAAADLLLQISAEHPTVLVLEDFQWVDEDSRELVERLTADLQPAPVLFVIVARPDPVRTISMRQDFLRISLTELSARDSEALLSRLLGIERLPRSLRDVILEKAEGNPFFMEEVILALEESGAIKRRGDTYRLARPVNTIEIPDTVEGLVLSRLDRLERRVRSVLQCASVIGQEFRYRVLNEVAAVGERLRNYMIHLVEGDYVLQQTLIAEMAYVFRHVVLRDVAYGTLLEKRRRQYHAKVAEAIEMLFPDNLEEHVELLAHHYERAAVFPRAVHYFERAALKCENLCANHAAAECWERLLTCLDQAEAGEAGAKARDGNALRLRANLRLGELCRKIGRARRGAQAYESAHSLARGARDARAVVMALMGLAECSRLAGDIGRGTKCLREARRRASGLGDDALRASCENLYGHFERMQGNFKDAGKCFEKVIQYADAKGDRKLRYQALNHLGIVAMYDGRLGEADERFREALDLARELGRKAEAVQIELNLGIVAMKRGDCETARSQYTQAASQAEKVEFELGFQLALAAMADLALKTGDFRHAAALSRQLLDRSREALYADVRAVALSNLARAQVALRKFGLAEKSLEESRRLAESDGNYVGAIDAMAVETELMLARGEGAKALERSEKMLGLIKQHHEVEHLSAAGVLRARAQLALKQTGEALKSARGALEAARRSAVPRDQAWALWVMGLCQKQANRPKEARQACEAARSLAQQVGDGALSDLVEKEPCAE